MTERRASGADGEPATVSIRVLGELGIAVDGTPVELPSRRLRALVAALAVRGRSVPVGELVDAVWDDDPPDGARATLQTYVSRLRRLVGRGAILHDPAGYRLGPAVAVDLVEVRAAIRDIERVPVGDLERRGAIAVDLLDRWTGVALGEFAESGWFAGARVELDEMHANLVDMASEGLTLAGRPQRAVALLESSLVAHPWREPSQILLVQALHAAGRTTDAVRAAARYRRDLGEHTGLVPGPAFDAAEAAVLAGAPVVAATDRRPVDAPDPARGPARLPRPTTMIGRRDDLRKLLAETHGGGIVTVTGPGGIGKTRLVAELLVELDPARPVRVVELAPVVPGSVEAALGVALDIRAERADPRLVAERLLGDRFVLVLDNAEHVIDEVRTLCRVVADMCPDVAIVVTSRARLDLPDETVITVEPLETDGDRSEAASLFVDRVRRARPRYELDVADPTIASLCRRLDGVPLALELAASRAAVLGVGDLERLLGSAQAVLGGVDAALGRHGTLGNVVAWSVGLLGEPAQRLLAALSVFRGEFDLAGASAVGAAVVDDPVALLLGRLVDTSLVRLGPSPGSYRLLGMVRGFAADRLELIERVGEVRRAHAAWLLGRVDAVGALVPGHDEGSIVAGIDAFRHEARTAIRWSVDSGEIELAGAIAASLAGPLLYRPDVDLLHELRWLSGRRSIAGASCEAAVMAAGARAAFLLGDLDAVDQLAERVLGLGAGEGAACRRAIHALGVVSLYRGEFTTARDRFDVLIGDDRSSITDLADALGGAALARCYLGQLERASDDIGRLRGVLAAAPSDTYQAFTDYVQAEIHLAMDEVDAGAVLLRAAADRAWRVGATFVSGIASTVLAAVLVRHRPPEEAREHLPGLIDRWRRSATWPQLWTTLRIVAEHLAATGQPAVARLVLAAADRDAAAPTLTGDDRARYDELQARLDVQLGAAAEGVVAAAAATDRSAVLERALDAVRASPQAESPHA